MNKYRRHSESQPIIEPAFVRLSVSGRRYDIPEDVAGSHVGSIFSLLASRGHQQDPQRRRLLAIRRIVPVQERWFAARTPAVFEIVLQYLYTGRLHCPPYVCELEIKDELKFWRLGPAPVSECCWTEGEQTEDTESDQLASEEYQQDEGIEENKEDGENESQQQSHERRLSTKRLSLAETVWYGLTGKKGWSKYKRILWRICHGPSSWPPAKVFNCLCILFIIASIINFVLSTLPALQCPGSASVPHSNQSPSSSPSSQSWMMDDKFEDHCSAEMAFDAVECACVAWFTLELLLRFLSCPNRRNFFKSPMIVIDALATFPYYLELVVRLCGSNLHNVSALLIVLRVIRVFRIFRILRLARYFKSLKLFGSTVAKSRDELGVLVLFLLFSVLIFSSVMYYVERDVEDTFYTSIPATFYWAVVTLTTTGYGDVTPKTALGKCLAGLACVTGILVVAFPVSILVEHFTESYKAKKQRRRRYLQQRPVGEPSAGDVRYSRRDNAYELDTVSAAIGSAKNSLVWRSVSKDSGVTASNAESVDGFGSNWATDRTPGGVVL